MSDSRMLFSVSVPALAGLPSMSGPYQFEGVKGVLFCVGGVTITDQVVSCVHSIPLVRWNDASITQRAALMRSAFDVLALEFNQADRSMIRECAMRMSLRAQLPEFEYELPAPFDHLFDTEQSDSGPNGEESCHFQQVVS